MARLIAEPTSLVISTSWLLSASSSSWYASRMNHLSGVAPRDGLAAFDAGTLTVRGERGPMRR